MSDHGYARFREVPFEKDARTVVAPGFVRFCEGNTFPAVFVHSFEQSWEENTSMTVVAPAV